MFMLLAMNVKTMIADVNIIIGISVFVVAITLSTSLVVLVVAAYCRFRGE